MWWPVRVTFGPRGVHHPQSYGGEGLPPAVVVMPPPVYPPQPSEPTVLLLVLVLLTVGHYLVGACLFCSMGKVYPTNVFVVVWGGVYPLLLCVVIVQMLLTSVYTPHQIARGGRDLGRVNPPRGPSRTWSYFFPLHQDMHCQDMILILHEMARSRSSKQVVFI